MSDVNNKKYASLNILKIFLANLIILMDNHNISTESHNDIRIEINDIATRLSALADCDDETLDQISEIVAYIKDNRELIEQVTTAKVSVDDIINNLETNVNDKPLSASQGVILNQLLEQISNETTNIKNTYVPLSSRGIVNGVAPLNANKKIEQQYLPTYTEINVTPSDSIADLSAKQTWSSEQTYNYEDYGNEIGFYIWNGVDSKAAVRDSNGNITTEGYNNLIGYEKVASITKDGGLILKSSTSGSNKYFKITVNDSGQISATQV